MIIFLNLLEFCWHRLLSQSLQVTQSPIGLHLIFEHLSLKNQVGRTWFFICFKLDFYCLCSLQKSSSKWTKNQVRPTWFFKNQVQINRGLVGFLLWLQSLMQPCLAIFQTYAICICGDTLKSKCSHTIVPVLYIVGL